MALSELAAEMVRRGERVSKSNYYGGSSISESNVAKDLGEVESTEVDLKNTEDELIKQSVISLLVESCGLENEKKKFSWMDSVVGYLYATRNFLLLDLNFNKFCLLSVLGLSLSVLLFSSLFFENSVLVKNLTFVAISFIVLLKVSDLYRNDRINKFKKVVNVYKGHPLLKRLGVNWKLPVKRQDKDIKDAMFYVSTAVKDLPGSLFISRFKLNYPYEGKNDSKHWSDFELRRIILKELDKDVSCLLNSLKPTGTNYHLFEEVWIEKRKKENQEHEKLSDDRIKKLSSLLREKK